MKETGFNAELNVYLEDIESEFGKIDPERIKILKLLGDYIISFLENQNSVQLVFICTHNSRRSQYGQVWANTAAWYYGFESIQSFSGGTESTAFNSRAVDSILRAGFRVDNSPGNENNPRYLVRSGVNVPVQTMYSKEFDELSSPDDNFIAIMVCSDADEECPVIPGARERISLPYEDPKAFAGTPLETPKYDERCREICRDVFFAFNYIRDRRLYSKPN